MGSCRSTIFHMLIQIGAVLIAKLLVICLVLSPLFAPTTMPDLCISSSIILTIKLIRRGLLACLLATLLIITDCPFLVKGLFFPRSLLSLIDVSSCFAAYIVFYFSFSAMPAWHLTNLCCIATWSFAESVGGWSI